jgi:hypothetical protein
VNVPLRKEIEAFLKRNGPTEYVRLTFHVLLNSKHARTGGDIMDEVEAMLKFDHLHTAWGDGRICLGPAPVLEAVVVRPETE